MFLKKYGRYIILMLIPLVVCSFYVAKLADWQIINGNAYLERANRSNAYIAKTEPVRGEILDINGEPLSLNVASFTIMFDRFSMPKDSENETILKLIRLLKSRSEPFIDELPIFINKNGIYEFMPDKDDEIKLLKSKSRLNINSYATAEDCMQKLVDKYNCQHYNREDQRNIISVRYNMMCEGYDQSVAKTYNFAKEISSDTMMLISERSQMLPGVRIGSTVVRKIVNGEVAPHIVGTTGKMSAEQYETLKDEGYRIDDIVGKSGIEANMEKYLKGKGGERMVETDRAGNPVRMIQTKEAQPGNTVFLTLDSNLQRVAYKSLEQNIKSVGIADCKAGGVVALSIKDFSVLAYASFPTFDLTKFSEDKEYYNAVMKNDHTPLYNRAFSGAFAPGSIYKPLVALGSFQEGCIDDETRIHCNGVYCYPGSNFTTKCLGHHGNANFFFALTKSCNVFFSEAGRRLTIEKMNLYAKRFGLGQKTGIEVAETAGVLAGPEHAAAIGGSWNSKITIKAAIGQSDNMFSPVQLATYVATIANNGNRCRTHLIRKIMDYKRQNIIMENDPEKPEIIENCGISEKNLASVKAAMRNVVLEGTAKSLNGFMVPVAAKTGTAQNSGSDHTTFVCYAPYENPEIAIGVVVEHGVKGWASINVAKDIMQAYFENKSKKE